MCMLLTVLRYIILYNGNIQNSTCVVEIFAVEILKDKGHGRTEGKDIHAPVTPMPMKGEFKFNFERKHFITKYKE